MLSQTISEVALWFTCSVQLQMLAVPSLLWRNTEERTPPGGEMEGFDCLGKKKVFQELNTCQEKFSSKSLHVVLILSCTRTVKNISIFAGLISLQRCVSSVVHGYINISVLSLLLWWRLESIQLKISKKFLISSQLISHLSSDNSFWISSPRSPPLLHLSPSTPNFAASLECGCFRHQDVQHHPSSCNYLYPAAMSGWMRPSCDFEGFVQHSQCRMEKR